jgi:cytochrome c-type biogenesis protein CcmE
MTMNKNILRITIAAVVVVGTIVWLAWSGATDKANTSYYVTIPELVKMGNDAYKSNIRVEGYVRPGSIEQVGTHVTFILDEFESHSGKVGKTLKINYKGSEPPPDTFKDNAQALAEGTLSSDGTFQANQLQAKCASKYAPASPGQPGGTPVNKPSAKPVSTTPAAPGVKSGALQAN